MLGVHPSHACSDDEVGLLICAKLSEIRQGFGRINWNVGGCNGVIWKFTAEYLYSAARMGGTESMEIYYLHCCFLFLSLLLLQEDAVVNIGGQLLLIVGDHYHGLACALAECLYNILDETAVEEVKAVEGFVKY